MVIRLTQTSARYQFPDPGELRHKILLRKRIDVPASDMGTVATYPETVWVKAKVRQVSATTWYESVQINQSLTHYFTIRFRAGLTADYEIVHKEKVYAVKRFRDLNEAGKYMLLECEELADASIPIRGSDGDSLFTR